MKSTEIIPFIRPNFPSSDAMNEDYVKILKNNYFTNFGPFERKFTEAITTYVSDTAHVSSVSNATLGLILAIKAICGTGDDSKYIIMPSFTFAAGAEAILWNRYAPLFIDIDSKTIQPDIQQTADYLKTHSKKVAAILFCNIFGVGDTLIKEWEKLAEENKIPLIIDSAAGFGSEYFPGERLGLRGDCEIFSFHATKPFGIGEGGAVISKNQDFIKKIDSLQNFGFDETREVSEIGFNAKLEEFSAAIGLRQIVNFENRVVKRREVLNAYKKGLSGLGFTFHTNSELSSVCFASVLSPTKEIADHCFDYLAAGNVQARRYYNPPLHLQKAFKGFSSAASLAQTVDISQRVISLPVHDNMLLEDVNRIIKCMKKAREL